MARPTLDRRSLLTGTAVAGLAASLPPATAARPTPHDPRVVVVGAGLAGLTCAHRLAQRGVHVEVLEARPDRVGGRCWTNRDFAAGQVAEHGGEFIDSRHHHLRRLVAELGLTLDDRRTAPRRGKAVLWLHGQVRRPHYVREHLPRVVRRLTADAERIGSYHAAQAGPAAHAFDELTVRDWLVENVPGGDTSLLYADLVGEMTDEFGLDPEELSAVNLIEQLVRPYPGADLRYRVHGGNDRVAHRLAARLPRGSLRLDAPLTALRRHGDGYDLRVAGRAGALRADRVVLALPFTTLRDVDLDDAGLGRRTRQAVDRLATGTNTKLHLQLDTRLGPVGWTGTLRADEPRWDTWDSSRAQPGPRGLLTVFSGGAAGTAWSRSRAHAEASDDVVRDTLGFLRTAVPGLESHRAHHAWLDVWADDPWARGSYAAFAPGQYTRWWGLLGRAHGGVHVAGEHTSTRAQGYLEGAVESGERAAREVATALGRR